MPSKYDRNMDICNKCNCNNGGVLKYDGASWHTSITSNRRTEIVHKIVQAIFPNPNTTALLDVRMNILIAYARKVEGEMYKMADTREEYHRLIAEKIYKIQVELKKKRRERSLQLRQQNLKSNAQHSHAHQSAEFLAGRQGHGQVHM